MTSTDTTARIGDTITGRCVTNGTTHTGQVVEVVAPLPGTGDSEPRFRLYVKSAPLSAPSVIVHLERIDERANPVPRTVTDADGNTWHATNEHGDCLSEWEATYAAPGDVRYRRQLRVTFPRYSKRDAVREHIAAAVLPIERVYTHSGDHWGGDDVTVTTELIFPASTWCMECGHDVRPDRYGRVSPYAVYRDPAGRSLSPTRNLDHATAHEMAAKWLAGADDGRTAHVGIDACG